MTGDGAVTGHGDARLDPQRVEDLFRECLADRAESDTVTIEGVVHTAVFNCAKLADRRHDIAAMLAQLPDPFRPHTKGGGGGWSFLNLCEDRDGEQWTGMHLTMEQLLMLGMATGQAKFLLPREDWECLPGGCPTSRSTLRAPRRCERQDLMMGARRRMILAPKQIRHRLRARHVARLAEDSDIEDWLSGLRATCPPTRDWPRDRALINTLRAHLPQTDT